VSDSPTSETFSDVEKIPAGVCKNCGVVADELVIWNFPNPATCGKCGRELEIAGMATSTELEEYA